jgi:hypothetical protein
MKSLPPSEAYYTSRHMSWKILYTYRMRTPRESSNKRNKRRHATKPGKCPFTREPTSIAVDIYSHLERFKHGTPVAVYCHLIFHPHFLLPFSFDSLCRDQSPADPFFLADRSTIHPDKHWHSRRGHLGARRSQTERTRQRTGKHRAT